MQRHPFFETSMLLSYESNSFQPMTPRQFLRTYKYDERLIKGAYYTHNPLVVNKGETVAVVLLNLGGPLKKKDIAPFLYSLFMDPAIIDIPVKGVFRHWLSSFIARTRSKKVANDYDEIGGKSPIYDLTKEQAESLEVHLNQTYGHANDLTFRTYVAMRYWHPTSEETVQQMIEDEISKVVLLPLYPQYSKTTTGSSLIYWWTLEKYGELPFWPTTHVYEYATHPGYIQAINERIDQGLEKFDTGVRDEVVLVFSAHGTPLREMKERKDPYCCLIHSTVEQVMAARRDNREFHTAFQSKVGPAQWLTPSTPDTLKQLAQEGRTAVLVVPVAFVSDHIETAYELDIEVREEAMHFGIHHYEVTTGLNSHPSFIAALGEVAVNQLYLPADAVQATVQLENNGNGSTADKAELKTGRKNQRTRCHQCQFITEARCWKTKEV